MKRRFTSVFDILPVNEAVLKSIPVWPGTWEATDFRARAWIWSKTAESLAADAEGEGVRA
jgi:hypothetical protein